jgi:CBS domain-containing protein
MHIRDVMTPNPRFVSPNDSIQNAARIMRDEDTGVVPVCDNGRAVGIITDRDIVVRALAEDGTAQPAGARLRHQRRHLSDARYVDP